MSKDRSKSPVENAYEAGEFETLSFRNDLERGNNGTPTWLSHVILEGLPGDLIRRIADAPGWDADKMSIAILLNGERVLFADFEKICSYFANRMYKDKLARSHFDNFEKAVKTTAAGMLDRQRDSIQEKLGELDNQLHYLKEQTQSALEREWNAPFMGQVTDKMQQAGLNALGRFFDTEPDVNFDGKSSESESNAADHAKQAVEAIWRAMFCAREDQPIYKIQLPKARTDGLSTRSQIREELMEEIKESLMKQGLVFEEKRNETD
jgi:hypothetical protein|uniref:Uncharacterized protein n=1 Tax=Myoviridae sp. ctshb19 TaxID=2825194 RepID=A0A8S5UGJ5_9CAUD|nr:MAG TPA: hypothetical protein [Myoviridae sp. ctshb19]